MLFCKDSFKGEIWHKTLLLGSKRLHIHCVDFQLPSMFKGGSSEKLDAGSEKEADHEDGSAKSTILQKFSPHLVKSILELLCDESVSLPTNKCKLKEDEIIHLLL